MSDVELRSSRSYFTTCKISEAFKLHQKSRRARNSDKEGKKERDRIERNYYAYVCISRSSENWEVFFQHQITIGTLFMFR